MTNILIKGILILSVIGVSCSKKKNPEPEPEFQPPVKNNVVGVDSFRDNFDVLNLETWAYQLKNYSGNGSNFRFQNVGINNSILKMLTSINDTATSEHPKPYNSGEIEGVKEYLYGYFSAKIKANICPGTVCSFMLINAYKPVNWEQKDIVVQILGKQTNYVQFSTEDYTNGGTDLKYSAKTLPLVFDAALEAHEYGMLWTADSVVFYLDKNPIHVEKNYIPRELMHMRINYYAGDDNDPKVLNWLGPVDNSCLPSNAEFDYVRYIPLKDFIKSSSK